MCRRPDLEHGERGVGGAIERHPFLRTHDGKAEPRAQPSRRVGAGGREEPGEVRAIELDCGKVVRLEIRGAWPRIHANDLVRVDADDVERASKAYRNRLDGLDREGRDARVQVDDGPLVRAERVDCRNDGGGTLPNPRKEDDVGVCRHASALTERRIRTAAPSATVRIPSLSVD